MLSLRIDIADDAQPVVTLTAAKGSARVSFPLNFDSANPSPQPKRRDGESDEAYAVRCGKHFPTALDMPPEYLAGLTERCREILDAVREIGEHYAERAAAEQALAAQGKAPPGVKQVKVGGSLTPVSELKKG